VRKSGFGTLPNRMQLFLRVMKRRNSSLDLVGNLKERTQPVAELAVWHYLGCED
jgi:hypothetical protein